MTHADLVLRAKAWLRRQRYRVVVGEVSSIAMETPDAIGFSPAKSSALVECKVSRADFFADAKKFFRRNPHQGMGRYRYFLVPPGLVKVEELPERWGLLYAHPRKIEVKAKAEFFKGEGIGEKEITLLTSVLMRVGFVCNRSLDSMLAEYSEQIRDRIAAVAERSAKRRASRSHFPPASYEADKEVA